MCVYLERERRFTKTGNRGMEWGGIFEKMGRKVREGREGLDRGLDWMLGLV